MIYFESDLLMKIFQMIVLFVGGLVLFRFAGKKSISQMTFPTLVVTISFGSLLVAPLQLDNQVMTTLILVVVMIALLIITELLEIKFNFFERFAVGHAVTLVENGELQQKELTKCRISIDQLEMFLRQKAIKHYSECEWVTIEPNGQIGYMLKKDNQPLTYKDFKSNMKELETRMTQVEKNSNQDAFKEVSQGKHDNPIDTKLE